MKLNRMADYAVRAVICIAQKGGNITTTALIAEEQGIPPSFLAKVMQNLNRGGIVKVHRGKSGGFSLAHDANDITVKTIVEAVEGPIVLNRCLDRPSDCNRDSFCGAHGIWIEAQKALTSVLDKYNVAELAEKEKERMPRTS